MILNIKKISPEAQLPTRAHDTDAGFDLHSLLDVSLSVGQSVSIPTGLAIALPENTVGLIYPRSSLGTRHGITLSNTVGVIDSGYRGHVWLVMQNNGGQPYKISKGDRIAQLIVTPYYAPKVIEVNELDATDRGSGGFGSSGL